MLNNEKTIRFEDFAAVSQDGGDVLGKVLYYSLSSILIDRDELESLCDAVGFPKGRSNRTAMGDAFRSATGDIYERRVVKTDSGPQMLNMPARYSFPFDYCSGLSLVLDKNSMTEVTRSQLALFQIDISVLEEDLDTAHQWYICKTPPSMCHVFEELYAAKEHETSQYFRIKVLELLYHATKLRKEDRVAATYYAREHIEIVKRVRKAMLKDLSRSTPLEQFLRGEAISTVTFQTIFKQIYGRSPYASNDSRDGGKRAGCSHIRY